MFVEVGEAAKIVLADWHGPARAGAETQRPKNNNAMSPSGVNDTRNNANQRGLARDCNARATNKVCEALDLSYSSRRDGVLEFVNDSNNRELLIGFS